MDGCDFCQLIIECFKGFEHDYTWPREWQGPGTNLDGSMYMAAKRLDVSDVKIAIEADQCFSGDKLEHVQVFDTLVVQVGASEERSPAPGEDDEYHDTLQPLPPLLLTLRVPRDRATAIDGFQIGRIQVEEKLDSDVYFDLARDWLRACCDDHPGCNPKQPPKLPTRVIDVGVAGSPINPRLTSSMGLRADYVALSHCWGGKVAPLLTTKTVDIFKEAVPYAELAANFRDAIAITRRLGIRYLWIDSLCILQDSRHDWEHESGHMAVVYGDATLTISAMAASASNVCILGSYPLPEKVPIPTTLRVFQNGEGFEVTVERANPSEESLDSLYHMGPLSNRGCTLQESLLSRRHLYYGKHQIYWKCPGGLESADGICARFKAPDRAYTTISRVLHTIAPTNFGAADHDAPAEKSALLQDYYELVQDYSRRKITHQSDKFPALSGLAQRFRECLGADYVAGLWSTDLVRGLLWKAELVLCRHVGGSYRAPSWSWAVTDDRIVFDHPQSPFPPSSLKMNILEYSVVPRNSHEPCGELESAHLLVEGVTTVLIRSLQEANLLAQNKAIGGADFDEPARDQTVSDSTSGSLYLFWGTDEEGDSYTVAARNRPYDEGVAQLSLAEFSEEQYTLLLVYADDEAEGPVECLILRQVLDATDGNTFERVGRANFWEPPMGWLMTWERRMLKLI